VRIAGGIGPFVSAGDLQAGFSIAAVGDELYLEGPVTGSTPVDVAVAVRDAAGNLSNEVVVTLSPTIDWVVDVASLLQGFLGSDATPLTYGERVYLDSVGNQNGRFDVGDLRRWMREEAPQR
jgi:hypothetical protein